MPCHERMLTLGSCNECPTPTEELQIKCQVMGRPARTHPDPVKKILWLEAVEKMQLNRNSLREQSPSVSTSGACRDQEMPQSTGPSSGVDETVILMSEDTSCLQQCAA